MTNWIRRVGGLMTYYVSHAKQYRRARIHINSCLYCRDGLGQAAQRNRIKLAPNNWSAPFQTFDEADIFMRTEFAGEENLGECRNCKPRRCDT